MSFWDKLLAALSWPMLETEEETKRLRRPIRGDAPKKPKEKE